MNGVTVVKPKPKSGLDKALDDVKAGRVYKAKDVDDLFKQILDWSILSNIPIVLQKAVFSALLFMWYVRMFSMERFDGWGRISMTFNPKERNKKFLQRVFPWKSSWLAGNAQLAKYFFLTEKKYFSSWIIIFSQLGNFEYPFEAIFVHFCPCFCWFWDVGRKCVDLINVYNRRWFVECKMWQFCQ